MLHGAFLRSQGVSTYGNVARKLAAGSIDVAQLSAQDRAMLAYAEKLTLEPATMSDADRAALDEAGFTDEEAWEITFTVSIFAMFNRMADAFGLEPPEETVRLLHRE